MRLRHLLSGQYLCIRPAAKNDASVLRFESNIITNKSYELAKNMNSAASSSPKKDANQGRSMTNNIVPFENFDTKTFGDVKKDEKPTTIDEKRAMLLKNI